MPGMAGARAFIERLTSHPTVSVAVATGGWRETGGNEAPGDRTGPGEFCLASSSDAVSRIEIMRIVGEGALRERRAARRTYSGDRT